MTLVARSPGLCGENMEQDLLDTLIIGENQQRCCNFVKALESLKCRCWFASTTEEIRVVLDRHNFRLVLSTRPITEGNALMLLLCKPKRTVFYSIPVENGCLWFRAFPEIVAGQRLSAIGAGAFKRLLTDVIESLKPPKRGISKSSSTTIFNPSHATRKDRGGQAENATGLSASAVLRQP